jgi:hypothetical protein
VAARVRDLLTWADFVFGWQKIENLNGTCRFTMKALVNEIDALTSTSRGIKIETLELSIEVSNW